LLSHLACYFSTISTVIGSLPLTLSLYTSQIETVVWFEKDRIKWESNGLRCHFSNTNGLSAVRSRLLLLLKRGCPAKSLLKFRIECFRNKPGLTVLCPRCCRFGAFHSLFENLYLYWKPGGVMNLFSEYCCIGWLVLAKCGSWAATEWVLPIEYWPWTTWESAWSVQLKQITYLISHKNLWLIKHWPWTSWEAACIVNSIFEIFVILLLLC